MAMVNMNNLLNGKDSRWLQLEVCREFQRNKCSRPDTECKFAHPPANVEVQNGRVTACYDSIKGRCNREKPPCKYFHPPQHLKDQLLINGRNHLALKNALIQQMGLSPGQAIVPGQVPTVAANPYLTGMPQVGNTYSPFYAPGPIMPAIMGPDPSGVASPLSVVSQTVVAQQKMPRSDRLEMDVKSVGSFYYDNFAFPGMMPYKRPAADKSGVPVYQPNATTYQQLMQLQQPFVPVSCEYTATPTPHTPATSSASPPAAVTGDPHALAAAAAAAAAAVSQQSQTQSQLQHALHMATAAGKEAADTTAVTHTVAATATVPSLAATGPDPATIAKEVAQQNYAKAVKLAQVGQSLAANSALNPLSYTGVALNKQAVLNMNMPPAGMPRFQMPLSAAATGTAMGLGLQHPYAAAMSQANLMNFAAGRPPAALMNPYAAYMRPPHYPAVTSGGQFLNTGLFTPQYAVSVDSGTITNATAAQNSIAAAAAQNNNNNNVVMPPYKKLKTT